MSVSNGQPITYADFAALATLANSKLSPTTPFSFPPFGGSDVVALPTKVTPVATYGSGLFSAGESVAFWLYSYKLIASVKTYSYVPVTTDITGVTASGNFSLTWTWVAPIGTTAPDGYVVVIPRIAGSGYYYEWKDIGNVLTLTSNGDFSDPSWQTDMTLQQNNGGNPSQNLPCGHGAWLKPWNSIHELSCYQTDIACMNTGDVTGLDPVGGPVINGSITPLGIGGLISGPWCVAVSGGADANTLSGWITRLSMYVQGATQGFTVGFTQCYRNIKFYFRAADGPMVDISASNQLSAFRIGSDILAGTTGHWHLKIISCSDGHIKVQDSGGGTVRADMDVTAGNVYDLSFDITGIGPIFLGLSVPLDLDFTFTTASATGAGIAAVGIELNNDVRSIAVPDSYCEIEFNNPVKNNVGSYVTVQLCTSCLQLTLTENNNVPGVWVANTLPTLGIFPYLDQDLPQYKPNAISAEASTRRIALNPSLPYIASVNNRGALWPVFRDTQFIPDSVAGQPVNGSAAWNVLGTKYVKPASDTNLVPPYEPGEVLWNYSTFVPASTTQLRFYTSNPNFNLYAKAGGFPTVADHDFMIAGGVWGIVPSGFATDTTWFYSVQNNDTSSASSNTIAIPVVEVAPNGTFFPTINDDSGAVVPQTEGYSYNWTTPASITLRPIPLYGYCVNSITVRRLPVNNASGIVLAPSTGTSDLSVDIGIMAGFGWAIAGTFTKLQTITIPAGQAEITTPVFWPVLSGTPLATTTSDVIIRASVNFQPSIHTVFDSHTAVVNGQPYSVGYYSGAAFYNSTEAMLSFIANDSLRPILLPVSATVLNDLNAVLGLLP